jgi:hypothetical protein
MASPTPRSFIKKKIVPALGTPATGNDHLDEFLQHARERIERLEDVDPADAIDTVNRRLQNIEAQQPTTSTQEVFVQASDPVVSAPAINFPPMPGYPAYVTMKVFKP